MVKFSLIVPLATLGTAFVLPDQATFQDVEIKSPQQVEGPTGKELFEIVESGQEKAKGALQSYYNKAHDTLDEAIVQATDAGHAVGDKIDDYYSHAQGWLDAAVEEEKENDRLDFLGIDDQHRPHHRPGHGHKKPNMTVYELIAKSKYTTKLAALINDYPDIVDMLNGTEANYTVFAPTDYAFSKIPKHAPKPTKEELKVILVYHVSPDFYPAGRVLATKTVPTLLMSDELGPKTLPQRLSTNIGLKGLTVNFYSRIVAINIFGTNGVIHGVDSLLIPPPSVLEIIDLLPSSFSTLELGLAKTGLLESLNVTHPGGTFFAPSNFAFARLPTKVNAFLFSPYGRKYLKALLEYHVVANQTLYSDVYYSAYAEESNRFEMEVNGPAKGLFHVDLPTMLKDRSLSVDIARYGRLIEIKINAFARVSVSDGVAKDGVIHEVSSVLIPPKKLANGKMEQWDGQSELTEEELIERLEPFVSEQEVMMDL